MAGKSPAGPPPEYATARTSVWWDVEGCPVPEGCDPNAAACNIAAALERAGYRGPLAIAAYGDVNKIPDPVVKALSSTGIGLHHVPTGVKDGSDKKILVDMLIWAIDNQAPANYLLISGDSDFSSVLHQLRLRKYNTLLAQSEYLSEPLISAANCIWLWTSLVAGGPALLPYEGGAGSESSLHDHFHPAHMIHRSGMQIDNEQRMPTLSYQQTTSKIEMKRHVHENRTGLSNFLFSSCRQHKKGMVPLNHIPRKIECNGPAVHMPHTSLEGGNKRHRSYIGMEKKTQKCKENNKCTSEKQRKRKENDPNYEEAYYNFKRQKKKETDQNEGQATLMQEIDLKKNNKETMKDELVQSKDISEQVRDVIEQNDVRQNGGASYMQDVIQYADEFEKNEMKRKRNELGQVEDGMKYDDNSKQGHVGMEHMDGSVHVEDEIYKAEQVENVTECMDGLKQAVNGRLFKNETVNYELEFKDEREETHDKMKGNKNGKIVSGPTVAGSGPIAGGSGAIGFDSVLVGTGLQFPQYELGEGFNRSEEARNLEMWQYEKFVKNGGRPFFGKMNAKEAFLWISSTIDVFRSMICPMEHRVRIITGAFQDEARIWWDSVMNSTFSDRQPHDITWEEFKAEFDEKYFSPNVKKRKEREFQTLKQGPMTVVQYETRFRDLERFALDLVPTERKRIERFYEGLHREIQMACLDRKFVTFSDIVRAAGETERVIATRHRRDFDERQQHPRPHQLEQGAQQRRQIDAPVAMRAMDDQVQDNKPPPCQICRRRHGGECRAGIDGCYSCGQLGHRAAACPTSQYQQFETSTHRLTLPTPYHQQQQRGQ